MEEEIDLREYVEILLKNWKWIAGFGMLAAVAAFVATTFLPPTFQATANLIILKSKTEISFTPEFQTGVSEQVPQKVYQDTLVSLVTSSDIAAMVLEQTRDVLAPEAQNILSLLRKVEAANTGDVVSISVIDREPDVAARIANEWATAYETYINRLFSDNNNSLLQDVQTQNDDTAQAYQTAQAAWVKFLGDNRIAALEREIDVKTGRAEALKNSEISILARELDIRKAQAESLRNEDASLERTPLYLYNQQQQTLRDQLEHKYQELRQMEVWLEDAGTMRDQLQKGAASSGASAGDVLALVLLRSKVLASSVQQPVDLQLSLADLTDSAVSVQDVDNLIQVINARKTRIEAQVADLSSQLLATDPDLQLTPRSEHLSQLVEKMDNETLLLVGQERWYPRTGELTQLINSLDTDILNLQAELETLQAQKRELKQTRDLTWENFTTVQRKLAEVTLASQITDSQVRVAGSAVTPEKPISPKRLLSTAVAGVLGVMLSVFGVFAVEYWKSEPPAA